MEKYDEHRFSMPARFPASNRMKRPSEFQLVYRQAKRSGDGLLLVFARANGLDRTRIGLSVSRKFGSSVRRSRIKRVLREAFRLSGGEIPVGMDLILIPRAGVKPGMDEMRKSLIRTAGILARKIGLNSSRGGGL